VKWISGGVAAGSQAINRLVSEGEFFAWLRLLVYNRCAVGLAYVYIVVTITLISFVHTLLRFVQISPAIRSFPRTQDQGVPVATGVIVLAVTVRLPSTGVSAPALPQRSGAKAYLPINRCHQLALQLASEGPFLDSSPLAFEGSSRTSHRRV
jgi:hypothetical protein